MNSLEEAKNRLDAALGRLEKAATLRMEDVSVLRSTAEEQEDLSKAHASLQKEHAQLKGIGEQTAKRLEQAMNRLGSILESKSS